MKLYEGETKTDFSNSCIYRIYCLDPKIKDIYVGSTTYFRRRYMQHRLACIDEKSKSYNFPLYRFMRENGGVDNWEMEIIEKFSCKTKKELLWKEREWYDKLKPKLNINKPVETKEEFNERRRLQWERYKKDKRYYEKNREKILERSKQRYQKNKDKILEKHKEKIECQCGSIFSRRDKARHEKSKKHQDYLSKGMGL